MLCLHLLAEKTPHIPELNREDSYKTPHMLHYTELQETVSFMEFFQL